MKSRAAKRHRKLNRQAGEAAQRPMTLAQLRLLSHGSPVEVVSAPDRSRAERIMRELARGRWPEEDVTAEEKIGGEWREVDA